MRRSEPKNLFELENLEERILLSGDSLVVAMPRAAPDYQESMFEMASGLPPLEEVLLTEDTHLQEPSPYDSDAYDPAQGLDDIFSGLVEENPSGDGEGESSPEPPYEGLSISTTQKEKLTQGLKEFARLGRVLEDFHEFGAVLPLTDNMSIGKLLGVNEILDARLSKPVFDYFNDAVDPPRTEGVLGALKKIPGESHNLDIALSSLDGGFAPADNEVRFDVKMTATRRGEVRFEAEVETDPELALEASAAAGFVATLELDYTFGVDQDSSEEFFITIRQFEAGLAIATGASESDVTPDEPSGTGETQDSVIELDAQVSVQFDEAVVADNHITLTELEAITPETIDDFVHLAAAGSLIAELPVSVNGAADQTEQNSPIFNIYIQSEDLFADDSLEITVKTDITVLQEPILEMLQELSELDGSITDSDVLNVNFPVIANSINQLLSDDQDVGLGKVLDFYTPALAYFTLLEVFNFDLTDQLNLSQIGELPGIDIANFDLENVAHRNKLRNLMESVYDLSLEQDWDINLYLPEIWSLLNEDFEINEYLPQFQLLLGMPYVPKMNEIRSDIKSHFGSFPSLKGLLDYIRTVTLDPLYSDFEGRIVTEPFNLSGGYFPDTNEVRFDFLLDAIKEVDFVVDLKSLFSDRFDEMGISFDSDLAFTLVMALNFDFSASVSQEEASWTIREASVTIEVNEDIDGLGVSVEDFPESSFAVSDGRFDFDPRVELIFHGLDPPVVEAFGSLSINLPASSDNPTRPTFNIYIQSDNVFDPTGLDLTVHLNVPTTFEFTVISDVSSEYTLLLNGENLEIIDDLTGGLLASKPAVRTSEIIINGVDDLDDTLTVDFSGGVPGIPVTYNGGAAGFDSLVIEGGEFFSINYGADGPDAGKIFLDDLEITYTGLEPVTDTTVVNDRVFNITTAGVDHRIRIGDDGDPNNGFSTIDSDGMGGFESITFLNPANSLTVNAGDGNDTILLDSLDKSFSAPILVNGEDGTDTLVGRNGIDAIWTITGAQMGTVGAISFVEIENLTGGDDNEDTFVFKAAGIIDGLVEGGAGGFDSIVLNGGDFETITYNFSGPNSGSIVRDTDVITYSGFEPLSTVPSSIPENPTDVILNYNVNVEQSLTIQAGTSGQTTVLSNAAEDVTFNNPSSSLTINAGSNIDNIVLNALDAGFNADLTLNAGAGDDHITVNAVTGSGAYTINGGDDTADTINVTGNYNIVLSDTDMYLIESGADIRVTGPLTEGVEAEPAIAVNPVNHDNIVVGAVSTVRPTGATPDDFVWVTTNGGSDWSRVPIPFPSVPPGLTVGKGDPSLAFSRDGKTLVYVHLVEKIAPTGYEGKEAHYIAFAVSDNGGESWSNSGIIGSTDWDENGDTKPDNNDKPYIAVGPDYLDNSRDRFVVTWHKSQVGDIGSSEIYESDWALGENWSTPEKISKATRDCYGAIPAVAPNGDIYVVWEDISAPVPGDIGSKIRFTKWDGIGGRWLNDSDGDGVIDQDARVIYEGSLNLHFSAYGFPFGYHIPASGGDRPLTMSLSIDVDRSGGQKDGRIYVSFTDQGDLDEDFDAANEADYRDTDVFVITSDDGGESWNGNSPGVPVRGTVGNPPSPVNDDRLMGGHNSQFMSWLDVDQKTGNVAVSWYDARNDLHTGAINDTDTTGTANDEVQYFAAVSLDGGQTFLPNVLVSDGTSEARETAGTSFYEYTALAFIEGTVYMAWADNSAMKHASALTEIYMDSFSVDAIPQQVIVALQGIKWADLTVGPNTSSIDASAFSGSVVFNGLHDGVKVKGSSGINIYNYGVPQWIEMGPGAIRDIGGTEGLAAETVSGAVQAIATPPHNADIIYLGTVNGGIWLSEDGGRNWRPLTDDFPSLSISALEISPFDNDGNLILDTSATPREKLVLFAGTGSFSNHAEEGGNPIGLLKSIDGGDTWTLIGREALVGRRITAVVPTRATVNVLDKTGTQVVLVSADSSAKDGGLFVSDNGGRDFEQINDPLNFNFGALPEGEVTDAVLAPDGTVYVAMPREGIFRNDPPSANPAELFNNWVPLNVTGFPPGVLTYNGSISPKTDNDKRFVFHLNEPKPTSININYTISSTDYSVNDDGSGTISGPNINIGRVDYDTGAVAIEFSIAPDSDISVSYVENTVEWVELAINRSDGVLYAGVIQDTARDGVDNDFDGKPDRIDIDGDGETDKDDPDEEGTRLTHFFRWADPASPTDPQSIDPPTTSEVVYTETGGTRTIPFGIHPGGQGVPNFSIVAHPSDPNFVFVGGDTQPGDLEVNSIGAYSSTGRLFRWDGNSGTWQPITHDYASGTAPHADSRAMVFDADGNILQGDDGGIYKLNAPVASPLWESLNSGMRNAEIVSIAYDWQNDVIFAGTQDNGCIEQSAIAINFDDDLDGLIDEEDEKYTWETVSIDTNRDFIDDEVWGDGGTQIFIKDGNHNLRYSMGNNLGDLYRRIFGDDGLKINNTSVGDVHLKFRHYGTDPDNPVPSGPDFSGLRRMDKNFAESGEYDIIPIAVNAVNDSKMLVGIFNLYRSLDGFQSVNRVSFTNGFVPPVEKFEDYPEWYYQFTSLAYGGYKMDVVSGMLEPNEKVIWAARRDGTLFFRPGIGATQNERLKIVKQDLSQYGAIIDIVLDPQDWTVAYAVTDDSKVLSLSMLESTLIWPETGSNWKVQVSDITSNLTKKSLGFQSVEFVRQGDRSVLLAGGTGGVFRAIDPKIKMYRISDGLTQESLNSFSLSGDQTEAISKNDLVTRKVEKIQLTAVVESVNFDGMKTIISLSKEIFDQFGFIALPELTVSNISWSELGLGLPNVLVKDLEYNDQNDLLIAGTLGRGTWTLFDSSLYLFQQSRIEIVGTSGVDYVTLRRNESNPSYLEILSGPGTSGSNSTLAPLIPLSNVSYIEFTGNQGNDVLNVDISNGNIDLYNNETALEPDIIFVDDGPNDLLKISGGLKETVGKTDAPAEPKNEIVRVESDLSSLLIKHSKLKTISALEIVSTDNVNNESIITSSEYLFSVADIGKSFEITGGTGFITGSYAISLVNEGTNTATLEGIAGVDGSTGGTGLLAVDNLDISDLDTIDSEIEEVAYNARNLERISSSLDGILSGVEFPFLGNTIENAIANGKRDEPILVSNTAAGIGVAQVIQGAGGIGGEFFRRVFETGTGAFNLTEVGSKITTRSDFTTALDGLDDVANNTSYQTSNGTIDLNIAGKTLSGTASVALNLLGGAIDISGYLDITAQVFVDLEFGVDSQGFFIIPDASADEIVISGIDISGDVKAVGQFGFLDVILTDAIFNVDDDAQIKINFSDPAGTSGDGKISQLELFTQFESILTVDIAGGTNATPDVEVTGTIAVAALFPGMDSPFELLDAKVDFIWNDISATDLHADTNFQIAANIASDAGAALIEFLSVTPQEILDQLNQLKDNLDILAHSSAFNIDISLAQKKLDELLNIIEVFESKITNPLQVSAGSNIPNFRSAQDIVAELALALGIDPTSLGLSYNSSTHELTYHLNFTHEFASVSDTIDFDFDAIEGLADVNSSSDVSLDADVTLDFILGVDLSFDPSSDSILDNFFIRDASISSTVDLGVDDFDASARFGFVEIEIDSGSGSANPTISVDLIDPGTNAKDGRIDLQELIDVLTSGDPLTLVSEPELTGSVQLSLPVRAPFLGVTDPTTITVFIPDISDPSIQEVDLGALDGVLDNFGSISFETVLAGLRALPNLLRQLANSGALGTSLPFIGSNLKDVIAVADSLEGYLDTLENFTTVEGLHTALENMLGTTVDMQVTNDDVQFAFGFSDSFSQDLGFNIEETVAGVEFELSGDLQATGSADVGIRFGLSFDGSLPETERFYLLPGPDSFVELAFKLITQDPIVATAELGFLRVGVQDGSATLAGRSWSGIDPAKDATASLAFVDPGTGSAADGKITLAEMLADPLAVLGTPTFDGAVEVVLPITPPIELPGVEDVTVQFDWSDLADLGSLSITYDEAALDAYLIDPASLLDTGVLSELAKTGLRQLGNWLDGLLASMIDAEPFTTELPLIDKSIADLLDLGTILPLAADAILSFVDDPGATTQSFVDQVATALQGLESSITGLNINVNQDRIFGGLLSAGDVEAASWLGYTPESDQLLFNIAFSGDRTLADQTLQLSAGTNALGVSFEAPFSADTTLDFDFTFGYDLTPGLSPSDAIFIRLNDLRAGLDIHMDASANFDLGMGALAASVVDGTLNLNAELEVKLTSPTDDPGGRLTLNDILGTSPAGLISMEVIRSSLEADLPLRVDLGGLAGAEATLIIRGDPLSGELPEFRLEGADFSDFTNLSQLTPSTIMSALEQIGLWLEELSGSDFLDFQIPIVDVSVGEALDLGKAFSEKVTSLLYNEEGVPTFNSIQEFVERLAGLAGIDPALLEPNYDTETNLLTYRLKLTHDFLDIPPAEFAFDIDLGPFGGVESSSQLAVDASGELDFTFGFDLSSSAAVLTANRPLPSSGNWPGGPGQDWRLPPGQSANFDLVLNGADRVSVLVSALATQNNTNSTDFVDDVNNAMQTALRAAGLEPNLIVAAIEYQAQGAFLTLTASESPTGAFMLLKAMPEDPAVTVLGFAEPDARQVVVLRSSGLPLPEDGRLSADAHFEMAVSGADPVTVTVTAAATDGTDGSEPNSDRTHLIADINAALTGAGLGNVLAGLTDGGRLSLTVTGVGASLQVTVSPNDTALTELGLEEEQSEGPYFALQSASASLLDQLVIEGLSVHGDLDVSGNFDATASFGLVDIVISDANATLSGDVDFTLIDPPEPIRVVELFDNLSDFGSYLAGTGLSLSGTAILDIPVSVEGALADLFDLSANAGLTVTAENIFQPDTWDANFDGLEELVNFGGFDFDTILQALESIVQYLRDISSDGVLGYELPLINVSVGDALDFAEEFAGVIQELRNNPAGTLQALDQKLEEAIASALDQAPGDFVSLVLPAGGQDFQIELNVAPNIPSYTLPLNFDLESLGLGAVAELPGVGNLLDVSGNGSISVEATAELNITLGLDLTDPFSPRPYLHDSTGLLLEAKLFADGLDFSLAVGPIGAYIRDGFVTLGVGSTPASLDFATFTVGMKPTPGGKYYFLESFPGIEDINIDVTGEVHAELPVHYPSESEWLDPAVHNISLTINSLSTFFSDPATATQFTTPDFSNLFDFGDLFGNIDGFIQALDLILGTVQDALDSEVFGKDLPLIGDNLKGAANFISDLRDSIQGAQDAIKLATDPDSLRTELFSLFGTQLGLLLDSGDPGDEITSDDIAVTLFPDPLPEGQDFPDEVEFQMKLGGTYAVGTSIGFDFGLPGLEFNVSDASSVELALYWEFNLGFGVSRNDGIYFTTYDLTNPDEHTLDVGVEVTVPDLQALGRIGFLAVLIEDDLTNPSHLSGNIAIDILDPIWDANSRLTFNDLASGPNLADMVDISLGLDALVNLDLTLGFAFNNYEADTKYPTLTSDFAMDWDLGLGGGFDDLSAPSVKFDNIHLNLGDFLSGFVRDIIDPIQQILEPVQPVIDVLTAPIPVLSDLAEEPITIIDVARELGYEKVANFVEAAIGVINMVNSLGGIGDEVYIDLGSLSFGEGFDLREKSLEGLDATSLPPDVNIGAPKEGDVQDQLSDKAEAFSEAKESVGGFKLKILENPSTAIGLLFGQNVELFEYEMPPLGFEFRKSWSFGPIWTYPPIYVDIGGRVSAEANLIFGYDTAGLTAFIDDPSNFLALTDGFYVSDRINSKGEDLPEVTFHAGLMAGASTGIPYLLKVGVGGEIAGEIYLNLHDRDDYGPPDGKIRLLEIVKTFTEDGPL